MLKKFTTVLLTGVLLLTPIQTVNAAGNYFVTLNGAKQNVTPIVQNGTTLLPVATVGNLVGYQAIWNNTIKVGVLTNNSKDIHFSLGSNVLVVVANDEVSKIYMPQPVKVMKGKTYLPLRAVGECLGMTVGYDANTREISLNTAIGNNFSIEKISDDKEYLDAEIKQLENEIEAIFGPEAVEEIKLNVNLLGFRITKGEYKDYLETIVLNKENIQKEIEKQREEFLKAQKQESKSKQKQPSKPKQQPKQEQKQPSKPKRQEKRYSEEELIQETLRLVNEERASIGMKPLEMKREYNDFAKWKANYLVEQNDGELDHEPHGKSMKNQAVEFGLSSQYLYGENLAGHSVPYTKLDKDTLYDQWFHSPGHHENMMSDRYTHIGIGVSDKIPTRGYNMGCMLLVKE